MRIVADINTIVSGILWFGPSSRVWAAMRAGQVRLFLTAALLESLAEVIARPKFRNKLREVGTSPDDLIEGVRRIATVVEPTDIQAPPELRDLDDLAVLACAVAAEADLIVSGDRDLLSLRIFQGIPIVTAADAARTFGLT